jgi:hypothetical protein
VGQPRAVACDEASVWQFVATEEDKIAKINTTQRA